LAKFERPFLSLKTPYKNTADDVGVVKVVCQTLYVYRTQF